MKTESHNGTQDEVAGLCNRTEFDRMLRTETSRLNRHGGQLGLIVFALDEVDRLRDRLGAQGLIDALHHLGAVLLRNVRASDVVGYWGDARFAVLAPEMDLHETTGFAVKLRRLVAEYRHNGGGLISGSFGVTEYRRGEPMEAFAGRALAAMQRACVGGGNRIAAARLDVS